MSTKTRGRKPATEPWKVGEPEPEYKTGIPEVLDVILFFVLLAALVYGLNQWG